ncbi:MAG TPA: hypothetical protein VJ911_09105 [Cryomorphaceae bacterium]|nr:hypothetical protein [Cryomorphaceae bacterium]
MAKLKHMLMIAMLVVASAAYTQDDICIISGEKMIFNLKRDWSADMRSEVSAQYGIDSAIIASVLGAEKLENIHFDDTEWKITYPDGNTVRLSKDVGELKGKWNYKKQILMAPEGHTRGLKTGPGQVDHSKVRFGVNSLSEKVITQYRDGTTQFTLPGYDNADRVQLVGSFNDWDMYSLPLKKTSSGWEITINLEPGKYLYKYIVDGNWIRDPNNNLREDDGYRDYNSIMYRYNHEFKLKGHTDAKKVVLTGSFNDWNEKALRMAKTEAGWVIPVYIKQGTYNYKFIVDKEWITDPTNPKLRDDGSGNENSVISIGDETIFELRGFSEANSIVLTGTFNDWNEGELKMDKTENGWKIPYALAPGNYEYKFIVDGEWIIDPSNPFLIYHGDYENSFIAIQSNIEFTLPAFRDAKTVIVTGSFNGWSEENNAMIWKEGSWIFPMYLAPGKHTYKFIVDGDWISDPLNPLYEESEFGSRNSILWVEDEKQLSSDSSME